MQYITQAAGVVLGAYGLWQRQHAMEHGRHHMGMRDLIFLDKA